MNNGNGNVAGDQVAEKAGKLINTRSKFDKLGYPFFTTNRFGEIAPFYVLDNVFGDHRNKLLSSSKVDSYTLKAPLMQDISMKKALYYVPLQAILPLNWEKWVTNPNIGQDCPDDCGTGVKNFWPLLWQYYSAELIGIGTDFNALDPADPDYLTDYYALVDRAIRCLIVGEYFYSDGSLLAQLGVCGSKYMAFADTGGILSDYIENVSFDTFFDYCFASLDLGNKKAFFVVDRDNHKFLICDENHGTITSQNYDTLSLREYLDIMRDDPTYFVLAADQSAIPSGLSFPDFDSDFLPNFNDFTGITYATTGDHLDLQRVLAYQLVCHHFYSNDKVDYIYSAELYRQYVGDLVRIVLDTLLGQSVAHFGQNGVAYQYDFLSAYYFNSILPHIFNYSDFSSGEQLAYY